MERREESELWKRTHDEIVPVGSARDDAVQMIEESFLYINHYSDQHR